MRLPEWDRKLQAWDRFKQFYIGVSNYNLIEDTHYNSKPMIMFDTGEVIFTEFCPRVDSRGEYLPIGVRVTTSKDYGGELWTPDGDKIAVAWVYDGGQEHLLVDEDTKRVVRVADSRRYKNIHTDQLVSDKNIIPGIPHRFQTGVSIYFPGPGLPPVPVEPIVAWLPFKKAGLTPEENDHISMIVDTARAAMKLTNHPDCDKWVPSKTLTSGCPLDAILKSKDWLDIPVCHLHALYHYGAQRKKMTYDYLLTEQP